MVYVVQEQNAKRVTHRPDEPQATAASAAAPAKVRQNAMQAASDLMEVASGSTRFNGHTVRGVLSMAAGGALLAGSWAIPLSWPFWFVGGAALFAGAVSTGVGLFHRKIDRAVVDVVARSNNAVSPDAAHTVSEVVRVLRQQGFIGDGQYEPSASTSRRGLIDLSKLEGPVVEDAIQTGWDPVAAGFPAPAAPPPQPAPPQPAPDDREARVRAALAELEQAMAARAGPDGVTYERAANDEGAPQGARLPPRRQAVPDEPLPADEQVERPVRRQRPKRAERAERRERPAPAEQVERAEPDVAQPQPQAAPQEGRRGYQVTKQKGT